MTRLFPSPFGGNAVTGAEHMNSNEGFRMPLTDTSTIILVVALVVVAALLVWLSLSMAAAESAVGRVTRART